ncbi:unnamed protein product [Rhizoctonia solani]|uniref:Uncharacterized protein n=1 Tax=Rhizoctonia solani TaxID=456999 RepID=A0A8H3CV84_9AGAM|nr:unnamed protein product [Rhizoctonia solani]
MKANGQISHRSAPKSKAELELFKAKLERKPYKNIGGSMEQVANNLEAFVGRINEISGFHDELVNQTFIAFAKELQYRVNAFNRLHCTSFYP